ncbi:MAG: hypothetical protein HZA79_17065 [Sphingobacteriales bacterium]|nr:hypothetical protein [Sphingobacteriales bacterium]
MKNPVWLFLLLTVLVIACNKDKFTTEPKVEVKSISPGTVSSGDVISLRAKYTDDEGDLDSTYIVYKWYNGTTVVLADTFRFPIDALNLPPKLRQAEMFVEFEYNTNNHPDLMPLSGVSLRDTTASFGLILIDKAKHRSNYSESAKIRLKKP